MDPKMSVLNLGQSVTAVLVQARQFLPTLVAEVGPIERGKHSVCQHFSYFIEPLATSGHVCADICLITTRRTGLIFFLNL